MPKPNGQPPTANTIRETCQAILSLANAVAAAYTAEYPGLWEPTTHGREPSERRSTDPTNTTFSVATSPPHADKRAWATTAWQHLQRAHNQLLQADEALGNIPLVDARHEPDTGPPGPWYQQGITITTPASTIPTGRADLAEAQAAMRRRHTRGE